VVRFFYKGGWPKKRQWALDNLTFLYDWGLGIDGDEAMTPRLAEEINRVAVTGDADGYYFKLPMFFSQSTSPIQRREFLEDGTVSAREGRLCVPADEYSNWEAKVWFSGEDESGLQPSLWGVQAERRRWLKKHFMGRPGTPILLFLMTRRRARTALWLLSRDSVVENEGKGLPDAGERRPRGALRAPRACSSEGFERKPLASELTTVDRSEY
jgi:hypothetical protein